jgi:hypothetical protein
VSGLEALLAVGKDDLRWQFVRRVGKLAKDFGIDLSDDDLQNAYTLRSKLMHSQKFLFGLENVLPTSEHRALYDKLESLLRVTLKRCFLDELFGQIFADDDAIKVEWPCPEARDVRKRIGK